MSKGELICVGTGMTMGAHLTPRSRTAIEKADVVFVSVSNGIVEKWIEEMNKDVRSLQVYYKEGKSRNQTYREMSRAIMEEVRKGKKVCGAFYGHPGVFALVPHLAIKHAKEEGFDAVMEPGISAEDCLYADLSIDPGKYGIQHIEASQFMMYQKPVDKTGYLVLWQIGVVGDVTFAKFRVNKEFTRFFIDVLSNLYPLSHEVIVYEAKTLPFTSSRIEIVQLRDLDKVELSGHSTLVVPPSQNLVENKKNLARLKRLNADNC